MALVKLDTDEAKRRGFGEYHVTVIPNYMVTVSDGTRLAMKVWFPGLPQHLEATCFEDSAGCYIVYDSGSEKSTSDTKFPVVLEYIPYRKADYTASRDYCNHTWISSHGYVVVRLDIRGAGDSEGLLFDEYLPSEQRDACDVINWLSNQPWCNGNVGMCGKSWSGFNGLQVAYEQPPALKTVISLYSTDDRYSDDVHYIGGCIPGVNGGFYWSGFMFAISALPPNPTMTSDWKEKWLERLEKTTTPLIHIWLRHQLKDKYWRHGSVNENYSRLKIPILCIGGYADGYTNPVFRLAEHVDSVKAIVGPWGHNWPDKATPGPNMAYLDECLRWWDCHLKGKTNGVPELPKFRVYVQDSCPPDPALKVWPGNWLAFKKGINTETRVYFLDNRSEKITKNKPFEDPLRSMSKLNYLAIATGVPSWFGWGTVPDLAIDQTLAESTSLVWQTDPLIEELCFIGFPEVVCTLSVTNGCQGQLAVRLCDFDPSTSKSTLITYGVLNLTHLEGDDVSSVKSLDEGHQYKVPVKCNAIGYRLSQGHLLRVAVSTSYWPLIWPSSCASVLSIFNGELHLPVFEANPDEFRRASIGLDTVDVADIPHVGFDLPREVNRDPAYRHDVHFNALTGTTKVTYVNDDGAALLKDTGTFMSRKNVDIYTITEDNPLSAKTYTQWEQAMEWPELDIRTRVDTESEMEADERHFYVTNRMTVSLNSDVIFNRQWKETIEREFV